MHLLPTHFASHRWAYSQVSREGQVAIYQMTHMDGPATRFEVIMVQTHDERMVMGRIQEAGDYYPGSTQWGSKGWTAFTLEEAQAIAAWAQTKIHLDS